jgi:hypothetical protein
MHGVYATVYTVATDRVTVLSVETVEQVAECKMYVCAQISPSLHWQLKQLRCYTILTISVVSQRTDATRCVATQNVV